MIKLVNGAEVALTPEEIAERLAEENAWAPPPKVPLYRAERALAYRDRLGKEQGDFTKTLGDVLDVVIRELGTRGPAVTPAFDRLVREINTIKAAFPHVG